MKLSDKVKAGEETKTGGSGTHGKGRYIFQFQEGIRFVVNDKGQGNSYTYIFPMKSVETAGGDSASVGGNYMEVCNVMYHGDELNKGGFDLFSALMVHSGALSADADVDITSQQFADSLKLKLVDKLVGIEIGHKKEKVKQKKNDDGSYSDLPEAEWYDVDRAFALKVFPVTGGAKQCDSAAAAQPAQFDY